MSKTIYYAETLPSIFKRIDLGEIHIPQFQRRFVWSRQQTLQLFDSIYSGLPIGNLLFWRSYHKDLAFLEDDFLAEPTVKDLPSYMYVIDGAQRLRVLYNCLHKKKIDRKPEFNVGFNLEERVFVHLDKAVISEKIVVLSSVFSYEDIMRRQIVLASYSKGQSLIKELNKLVSRFAEYQIPITIIDEVTEDELITVFQRINTSAVALTKEEILRARKKYHNKED
jgi:uncharacterized protein with ParB-like and HNH nuclease domain